jgi:hypothetical protein
MKALHRLLFDDENQLQTTFAQALALEEINTAIRELLPAEGQSAFIGVAWSEEGLSLFLRSAAWAQSLRFMEGVFQAQLLDRNLIPPNTPIRLKVSPNPPPRPLPERPAKLPSSAKLAELELAIKDWEKNSALKDAMQDLIKRLSSLQN